jgi:hypothetical protein
LEHAVDSKLFLNEEKIEIKEKIKMILTEMVEKII